MGKKKRLGDLYRTHTTVECDDGSGEKIVVSLVKINRPETDAAGQAANAARARRLMRRYDRDSEVWQDAYGEIADRGRDEMISVLIADDFAQKRLSAEAAEEAEEKWAEDEYLDGLRKIWEDELMMAWASDPEDPDAKRVFDELTVFNTAVEKRMEGESEDLAEAYAHVDDEELRAKVVVKLIENTANALWIAEFEIQRIYYATREMLDRSKRYFESIDEVRDLDDRILAQLRSEYDGLSLDLIAGKEPQPNPGSSPPSEPSTEAEASTPSGPETSDASRTSPTSS